MVYLWYVLSTLELLFIWANLPCNASPRYKNIKKQFLVIIASSFGTCSEIDHQLICFRLITNTRPIHHSFTAIAKGSTVMNWFVGLQTVVTLLCGFEKKYEGNYEKKSQISTDSGNLEQWHFQIFFVSYIFLWTNYNGYWFYLYHIWVYCACSCF